MLDSATYGFLRQMIVHREKLAAALAELGLHLGQELTLAHLWVEDGLSQVEIAERVGVTAATSSKVLRGLERAGLVRRERDARDTRVVRIWLTDEGRALEGPVNAAWFRVEAEVMGELDEPSRRALARLASRRSC